MACTHDRRISQFYTTEFIIKRHTNVDCVFVCRLYFDTRRVVVIASGRSAIAGFPPKMPARYFSARRDFSRRTEIFLDAPRKTRRAEKNSARRENSTRRENLGAPRSKIAACTFLARRIELVATKTIATRLSVGIRYCNISHGSIVAKSSSRSRSRY